jgi:hypothetical protein
MELATERSPKCFPKCHFFMVCWRPSLKRKHTFGLRRRELIEVQAILKTVKRRPQHDMQTDAHFHLRFLWKNVGKPLKMDSFFGSKTVSFSCFCPWGSAGPEQRPRSCPRAAKIPQTLAPKVHQGVKRVWKCSPKAAKTWTLSAKRVLQ